MSDTYADNQQTTSSGGWKKWIHLGWIRTPLGLIKIGEFFMILLGLITMSTVGSIFGSGVSSLEFFMFVHTTVWVITLIVIILHVLDVYKKLPLMITSNIAIGISCAIASVVLFICSLVPITKFQHHQTIVAGGVFGFMSMGLFIAETIYYFLKFRREGAFPQPASPPQTNMADQYQDTPAQY